MKKPDFYFESCVQDYLRTFLDSINTFTKKGRYFHGDYFIGGGNVCLHLQLLKVKEKPKNKGLLPKPLLYYFNGEKEFSIENVKNSIYISLPIKSGYFTFFQSKEDSLKLINRILK